MRYRNYEIVKTVFSAIFQSLQGVPPGALRRVILTASGGAFRDWPKEKLAEVRVADALKHPNWAMGAKITGNVLSHDILE